MAKIILCLLLFISCNSDIQKTKIEIKDNTKIYSTLTHYELIKKLVKREIHHYEKMYIYNDSIINKIVKLIVIGEQEFSIDAFDTIALISIESNWNFNARRMNTDSIDYGLTQQNSCCMIDRYFQTEPILTKHKIDYNIRNRKDIALNIVSAYLFLNEIRSYLIKRKKYTRFRFITSYNAGYGASVGKRKLKRAIKYYQLFNQARVRIAQSSMK